MATKRRGILRIADSFCSHKLVSRGAFVAQRELVRMKVFRLGSVPKEVLRIHSFGFVLGAGKFLFSHFHLYLFIFIN